mmetsp:Transcript_32377/g.59205  ORF Transcript_32377/g.59205 Transcript_32377/m.59205 type:complete len:724 (-) Transcript_32377:71-2242(-)
MRPASASATTRRWSGAAHISFRPGSVADSAKVSPAPDVGFASRRPTAIRAFTGGLEYEYAVGKRVAERARARKGEGVSNVSNGDDGHGFAGGVEDWMKNLSKRRHAGPSLVDVDYTQAGKHGSVVVLTKKRHGSTGEGYSHLRKRRQKLTGRLLKDSMVEFGESVQTVSWWWTVFERYADTPMDPPLPALPKKEDPQEVTLDMALARRPSSPNSTSFGGRSAEERRVRRLGLVLFRKLVKPKLRGVFKAPERLPRSDVDEALWTEHETEYRVRKLRALGLDAEELDLFEQCQQEALDVDKLTLFADLYEAAAHAAKQQAVESRSSTFGGSSSTDSPPHRDAAVQRLRNRLFNMDNFMTTGPDHNRYDDSSDDSTDESEEASSSEWASGLPAHGDAAEPPFSASIGEVMLRTSNTALMKSKVWKEQRRHSKDRKKLTKQEVLEQRAALLRGVTPVKMTVDNLFAALSCAGLARRAAAERIFNFLSCPLHARGKTSYVGFPAFFRFLRAVQKGRPQLAGQRHCQWHSFQVLRKLIYVVLTDTLPQDRSVDSKAAASAPLSSAVLLDSFQRVMLCSPVLLGFNGAVGTSASPAQPTLAATGSSSTLRATCVPEVVEALHQEFIKAEKENLEACGHEPSGSPSGLSFAAFERFVFRQPGVFMRLTHILLPLAMECEQVFEEEMDVKARQQMQKARELKARIDMRIQQMQRKHLLELLEELRQVRMES